MLNSQSGVARWFPKDTIQAVTAAVCRDLRVKSLSTHVTYPWEPKIDRCSDALRQSDRGRYRGTASHVGRRLSGGSRPFSRLPCSGSRHAPFTRLETMSTPRRRKVLHIAPRFIARRRAGPRMSRRSNPQPRTIRRPVGPVGWMGWLDSTSISSRCVWDTRPCAKTTVPARVGSIGTQHAGWRSPFILTSVHTFTECSATR
jgi:hypothetical protein